MAQQVFTSTTTWTCPTGVTSVAVWCYGGGGGGGGSSNAGGSLGSGAGGGAFAFANIAVTSGTVYTVTVGTGGTGGSNTGGNGGSGGDSWFNTNTTVLAKGAAGGGANSGTPGSGGSSASCIGTIVFSGGNGASPGASLSGGGGGGAGWQAVGGAAVTSTAGAAGNGGVAGNDPGKGGTGTGSGNGKSGVALSGGGSGAETGTNSGGAGAAGLVALEYGTSSVNQVQLIMAASGNTAGTTATVSWPTTTTAGNLLVASLTVSLASATVTTPAGWTKAVGSNAAYIFYIQNASAQSGSVSVTISSTRWFLELREYSGVLISGAVISTGSQATSGVTAMNTGATSGNPATVNDLTVGIITTLANNTTFSGVTATSGTPDFMNDGQETANSFASFAIVGGLSTGSTEEINATASVSGTNYGAIAIFGAAGASVSSMTGISSITGISTVTF